MTEISEAVFNPNEYLKVFGQSAVFFNDLETIRCYQSEV